MNVPLRIGLIGCGYISRRHLAAWRHVENAKVVAVCDQDRERVQRRAEEFGIEGIYTDAAAMMARASLDAVDVTTRPAAHEALVTQAARRGLHVLCQKPLAPTLVEAQRMVEACDRAGVRFMVAENWRWHEWYQLAKSILAEGQIGEPRRVRLSRAELEPVQPPAAPGEEPTQSYFREMKNLAFYEFGIHLVDVMRFLFGEPLSVYAQMARVNPELAGEDVALAIFHYDRFAATIEVNWADPFGGGERLEIDGSEGSLRFEGAPKLVMRTAAGRTREWPCAPGSEAEHKFASHIRLQDHFVERLFDGRPFETSGRDNLGTLGATLAAYECAARNVVQPLGL